MMIHIVNALGCIDELLSSSTKVDLEAHTESGWTALHLAAKIGSLLAVEALVKAGVEVNSVDRSYGRTALHIAVDSNHIEIVNYLLAKVTSSPSFYLASHSPWLLRRDTDLIHGSFPSLSKCFGGHLLFLLIELLLQAGLTFHLGLAF
jgi:hypothetical protein